MSAKELLIKLFSLPKNEIIFQDYGCALQKGVLKHGRMFVSENHISFYANILGIKTKVVINVDDITAIEKKRQLGIIQNAIEITLKDNKTFFFCSFGDRDSVYSLLYAIWKGEPVGKIAPEPEQQFDIKVEGASGNLENSVNQIENSEVEVSFLQTDSSQEQKQELVKATFPVSAEKFFELFFSDEAVFSLQDHRKARQDFECSLSKWQQLEEGGFTRELNAVIKLNDVPFKDRSRLYKLQTYTKKENQQYIIQSMTKTLDVPMANSFQNEELWEINPIDNEPNKCQIRIFAWVVFLKSSYLKKTIQSRSLQGLKEDFEIYIGGMTKKLESLQAKPTSVPQVGESRQHEYEESKTMEANMIQRKTSDQTIIEKPLVSQENPTLQKYKEFLQKFKIDINSNTIYLLGLQAVTIIILFFFMLIITIQNQSLSSTLQRIEQQLNQQNIMRNKNDL